MNESIKRNIDLCRKCPFFHEANDAIQTDGKGGWHRGTGYYCSRVPFMVPWSKYRHAVPGDLFIRADIYFANESYCPQNRMEVIYE